MSPRAHAPMSTCDERFEVALAGLELVRLGIRREQREDAAAVDAGDERARIRNLVRTVELRAYDAAYALIEAAQRGGRAGDVLEAGVRGGK